MDDTVFFRSPPQLILNLMKDTFGDYFNTYFLGSPTMLPEAAYPSCIVQPITSKVDIRDAPTGFDSAAEQINIHFLLSSKDDLNASDDVDTTMWKIYTKVQGRDPQTGQFKTGTAMNALRANLQLTDPQTGKDTLIDHDIDVNYDVTPRVDQPTIVEAILSIVTRELIRVVRVS